MGGSSSSMAQLLRLCERGVVTGGDADELLAALQAVMGCRGVVVTQSYTFASDWHRTANLTTSWMEAHTRYREHDPSDMMLMHRPFATPYLVEADTLPENRRTPLHLALRDHGFTDVAIARLYSPFRSDLMLALYRFDGAPAFDERDREVLMLTLPAVSRGLSSRRALAAMTAPAGESLSTALPTLGGHFFISLPRHTVTWSRAARDLLRDRLQLDASAWQRAENLVVRAATRFLQTAEGARSQRLPGRLRIELAIVPPERGESQRLLGWLVDDTPERAMPALAEALLSPRQRDVAMAVVRGESMPGLAARLGVSVETVRTHVRAVYRRCGVRSRAELARLLEG